MTHAHRHDDIELNITETGSMHYLFSGADVHVGAGEVAGFWAAKPHQLVAADPASYARWVTVPLPTFLRWNLPEPFVTAMLRGDPVITEWGSSRRWEANLFDRWSLDLASASDYLRATALLEIQAWIRRLGNTVRLGIHPSRARDDERGTDGPAGKAAAMAAFIAAHYAEPVGVDDIAATVHLHPRYAMTLFRRVVGTTPLRYLTQCRVAEAQRLLLTTDLSTADVGYAAGFGSQSAFYQAFSTACGQAPAAYRRAIGSAARL